MIFEYSLCQYVAMHVQIRLCVLVPFFCKNGSCFRVGKKVKSWIATYRVRPP